MEETKREVGNRGGRGKGETVGEDEDGRGERQRAEPARRELSV